ncbi:glycerophosphodiester phosphodiesterase family protein [Paenibacillus thalictri]|uniref:glycerophosphodiester phosphodiesterase family protein n=1 Tax=Paenibacillus thalictri TaxID=2527873 RepID=UPI001F0F6DAF|nr:glycerophosphodiester phosphodiesterase family protein [Paenibacillus thalictri]
MTIERLANLEKLFVVGHRGYKEKYLENTLLSFQKSLDIGVDVIEFDLRLSRDHQLVIIHDETVDRTTNGSGPVSEYTLHELQQLDAGGWFGSVFAGLKIPTLEQLCELLKNSPDVLLNVEIKPGFQALKAADMAVAELGRHGYLPRCVFTSFDADVVAHIYDTYGLKTQGFPSEKMKNFIPEEHGTYSKMWSVGIAIKDLTPERVKQFRELGLLVGTYCPDSEEQARYAVSCGINRMTCNNPLAALSIRSELEKRA